MDACYLTGSARHELGGSLQQYNRGRGEEIHLQRRRQLPGARPPAGGLYQHGASGFNPSPQFDADAGALLGNLEWFGSEAGLKGALMDDRFS